MSINFEDNNLSLADVLAEYPTGLVGVTEVIGFIEKAIDAGIATLDETSENVDAMVEGFRAGLTLLGDLPPEFIKGSAAEIIHATRYFVDVADAARAAGRKVTLRSLGLTLASLGLEITQRDADAGNPQAQAAIADAKRLGLL